MTNDLLEVGWSKELNPPHSTPVGLKQALHPAAVWIVLLEGHWEAVGSDVVRRNFGPEAKGRKLSVAVIIFDDFANCGDGGLVLVEAGLGAMIDEVE